MWFERTFGFREETPEQVRANLVLDGRELRSVVTGVSVGCGWLEVPRLDALRELDRDLPDTPPSRVSEVVGDVTALHRDPVHAGALFQAASQFNLLEMVGPDVTPERGVGIYEQDRTQGPACAIACGGGTVYRNYLAPVGEQIGQTAERQIDALADLDEALGGGNWDMRNGYALCTEAGLRAIGEQLASATEAEHDRLRGLLRVGVQHEVQVLGSDHHVTQVYGSALPVAYGRPPRPLWEPFARLVLEASYEATLRIARIWQAEPVFLTLLGGGVFGNEDAWIADSIAHAIERVPGLDVRIVSYNRSRPVARCLVERFAPGGEVPRGRTSRAFPLRVDDVDLGDGGPPLGLTFAPGKVQQGALTGAWRRSLEADLDRLRHVYGVDDLVCLLEDHELRALHVKGLPDRAAAHGIRLHRRPQRGGTAPDRAALEDLVDRIQGWRADGRRVAVHGRVGQGRAGTVAAACLIRAGVRPEEAIRRVRAAR